MEIACINDLSERHKPKSEEKNPKLLESIRKIMEPCSQAEPRLRTTLLYTNMTAQAVYNALVAEGWPEESLPAVRTLSNILNRQIIDSVRFRKPRLKKNSRNRCHLQQRQANECAGRC